jgi:hypothetical protein
MRRCSKGIILRKSLADQEFSGGLFSGEDFPLKEFSMGEKLNSFSNESMPKRIFKSESSVGNFFVGGGNFNDDEIVLKEILWGEEVL